MEKKYFILFFLFTPLLSFSQEWIKIPGTKILFSNFTHVNIDSSDEHNFEYFKKEGQLLMVEKKVALSNPSKNSWGLYTVFEKSPEAFDSIFKYAPIVFSSPNDRDFFFELDLDSNLNNIPFSKMVEVHHKEVESWVKQERWTLTNSVMGLGEGPCDIYLVFKRGEFQDGKFNLKFLYARKGYCRI